MVSPTPDSQKSWVKSILNTSKIIIKKCQQRMILFILLGSETEGVLIAYFQSIFFQARILFF